MQNLQAFPNNYIEIAMPVARMGCILGGEQGVNNYLELGLAFKGLLIGQTDRNGLMAGQSVAVFTN
jgi:hypothetical protein